jgi:protein transport protein SEC31
MDKLTLEPSIKCPAKDEGVIKSISWNDKISHILAAASTTGIIYIWEMRKVELFLTICDSGIFGDSDEYKRDQVINTNIAWCSDGVQLIIAYDHPEYNFLTQYHMKIPNAPSAEYHGGHQEPILEVVKNPFDSNLILSLGRENVATCWSVRTQKPLVHVNFNNDKKVSSIMWLNKSPDIFISATLDGEINYHQVNFSGEISNTNTLKELTEAPKWLTKKSGICFAFGGKFVTFSEKNSPNITLHSITGNSELSSKMKTFIHKIEKSDLNEMLDEKIDSTILSKEKNVSLFWIALKSCYTNNYNDLFRAMGFDKSKLQKEVYTYIGKKIETQNSKKERQKVVNLNLINTNEAEDFWNTFSGGNKTEKDEPKSVENSMTTTEKPHTITETITKNINWNLGTEKLIKQSLLIGDLQSAVDVALKCGRDAEALLIASAGDKELFNKTKQAFFNKNKDLFIKNIFSSIINGEFESLLDYNVLKDWKEYILYARTYLEGPAFISFANNLGDRISNNPDIYMALVCYILGRNYDKCVELLYNNYLKEIEKLNRNQRKFSLHQLFEQVIAIKNVFQYNLKNDITEKIMINYSELLINEGLFEEACTYITKLKNSDSHILTLYDRLYNHCDLKVLGKFVKLPPPFNITVVKPKVEKKIVQNLNIGKGNTGNLASTAKPSNTLATPTHQKQDLFDKPVVSASHNMQNVAKTPFGAIPTNPVAKPVVPTPTPTINKPPTVKQPVLPTPTAPNYLENKEAGTYHNKPEVPQFTSANPISTPTVSTMTQPIKKPVVGIKPVNPPMPMIKKNPVEERISEPVTNPPVRTQPTPVPNFSLINSKNIHIKILIF